jgi:putative phosphoesterase
MSLTGILQIRALEMDWEIEKSERVAFISDIHSNLEALQEALAEIRGLPIYCLGDIIGYGASPNQVIDLLRKHDVKSILGNHDHAVFKRDVGEFNSKAAIAILWTAKNLTDESLNFLTKLPLQRGIKMGEYYIYMTHGSPDDNLWEYVDPSTHSYLFDFYLEKLSAQGIALGHTHIPYFWKGKKGIIFNPGSVGQPRSGDNRASYAILSVDDEEIKVTHHKVSYNIESSANKIVQAGLPEVLGRRLFSGT